MATTAPGMVLFSISRFSATAISASFCEDTPTDSGLALGNGSPASPQAGAASAKNAAKMQSAYLVIMVSICWRGLAGGVSGGSPDSREFWTIETDGKRTGNGGAIAHRQRPYFSVVGGWAVRDSRPISPDRRSWGMFALVTSGH